MFRFIATEGAPAAIGPYSQAVAAGPVLFCSGQIALDPATGEMIVGNVTTQTRQVLANLEAVLNAAGSSLSQIAKTTVYVTDLADFATVNAVYAEVFGDHKPARATVEVSALPKGALVEIDAIAAIGMA